MNKEMCDLKWKKEVRTEYVVDPTGIVEVPSTAKDRRYKISSPQWRIPIKQISYQPETLKEQGPAIQSSLKEFVRNLEQQTLPQPVNHIQLLVISVVDRDTDQPVPEAEVILIGEGVVEATSSSGADGRVNFRVNSAGDYIVDISKERYQGNAIILESRVLLENTEGEEVPIALERETGTVDLTARLYDERTSQAIAHTLVRLVNTATGDTISQSNQPTR